MPGHRAGIVNILKSSLEISCLGVFDSPIGRQTVGKRMKLDLVIIVIIFL